MTGRPPLEIGTHGEIFARVVRTEKRQRGTREVEVQVWRARTRFRDADGVTREITATGMSETKARSELLVKIRDRTAPGGDLITPQMRLSVAAEHWLNLIEAEVSREKSTVAEYRRIVERSINPPLGNVLVRELSAGRIERFLKAARSESSRKKAKMILGMLLDTAVRDGALVVNPVRSTSRLKKAKRDIRVLEVADLDAVRTAVRQWVEKPRPGPKANMDMPDIVDMMLATACRIGEVLAIRWADVLDLWGDTTVVRVTGTVKKDPGGPTYRKETPKSEAGERDIVLPPFAVEMLRRRHADQTNDKPNPYGAVFPTRTGTWHQVTNVERRWRQIRHDTRFDWVTPHVFRKTVTTLIDRVVDTETAARLAGHSSTDITKEFYIAKDTSPVDVSAVVESFAAPKKRD